jgi:hypothetical protein
MLDRYRNLAVRECRAPLPITLHINRESQGEDFMHYLFVLWKGRYELREARDTTIVSLDNGPYCFDPGRDVAFVNFCCFRMRNRGPEGS